MRGRKRGRAWGGQALKGPKTFRRSRIQPHPACKVFLLSTYVLNDPLIMMKCCFSSVFSKCRTASSALSPKNKEIRPPRASYRFFLCIFLLSETEHWTTHFHSRTCFCLRKVSCRFPWLILIYDVFWVLKSCKRMLKGSVAQGTAAAALVWSTQTFSQYKLFRYVAWPYVTFRWVSKYVHHPYGKMVVHSHQSCPSIFGLPLVLANFPIERFKFSIVSLPLEGLGDQLPEFAVRASKVFELTADPIWIWASSWHAGAHARLCFPYGSVWLFTRQIWGF